MSNGNQFEIYPAIIWSMSEWGNSITQKWIIIEQTSSLIISILISVKLCEWRNKSSVDMPVFYFSWYTRISIQIFEFDKLETKIQSYFQSLLKDKVDCHFPLAYQFAVAQTPKHLVCDPALFQCVRLIHTHCIIWMVLLHMIVGNGTIPTRVRQIYVHILCRNRWAIALLCVY